MKILVFDDNYSILTEMKKYLQEFGPVVLCADSSSVVYELVKEHTFDAYILDLNAFTLGLTSEQTYKTQNGLLTGWVLLTDIILPKDSTALEKTIIFSDYITFLERYIQSEATEQEKEWFNRIRLVPKIGGISALTPLIEKIKGI